MSPEPLATEEAVATSAFAPPPSPSVEPLLELVRSYAPTADLSPIARAFALAGSAHEGQVRESGEAFVAHPLAVATVLAELNADIPSIVAGLLHDVVEDTTVPLETIHAEFGEEVAELVDGLTKLTRTELERRALAEKGAGEEPASSPKTLERAANIRKLLLAMAADVRVMVIKLADRLHNMRTLEGLPEEKQRRIAEETLQIFAPLAHRLGIWHLKAQLEDLAFKYLERAEYLRLAEALARSKREREADVAEVRRLLGERLAAHGITADIQGRAKHLYSIWNKIRQQKLSLDELYDLIAVRVIVATKPECYLVLGHAHDLWLPIPGLFSDHIAQPKPNGYQSLHTKVIGPRGEPVEIQIRTQDMHRTAEFGVAAHWAYKEGDAARGDRRFEEKLTWLRQQLFEWQNDPSSDTEFLRSVVETLFADQVFVFTPRGDVIDLCSGSCPIDYAFRIHTEVGLRCAGARVNGRQVPLSYQFKNGDIVEIQTRPSAQPSADWLNLAKTSHARSRIRAWLRKQRHTEYAARGRELLEKEAQRHGMELKELLRSERFAEALRSLNYGHEEDMLAAIGHGFLAPATLLNRLRQPETPRVAGPTGRPGESGRLQVTAGGLAGLMMRRAPCCLPLPGDEVMGFTSRDRGIIIHRATCPSFKRAAQLEEGRVQPLSWPSDPERRYHVPVRMESLDRQGLLAEVTQVFGERKINVEKLTIRTRPGDSALWDFVVDVCDTRELAEAMRAVRTLPDMLDVTRLHAAVTPARVSTQQRRRTRRRRNKTERGPA